MAQLTRTQILLEPEQHKDLQSLAAAEDRSMSELVREAVADYLTRKDYQRSQWQETLAEMIKIRAEIEAEYGILSADFILGDREEREEELWQRALGVE